MTKNGKRTLKDLLGQFEKSPEEELQNYIDHTWPLYIEPGTLYMAVTTFRFTEEVPEGEEEIPFTYSFGGPTMGTRKTKVHRWHPIETGTPVLYLGYELYDDLSYLPWWLIGDKAMRGHIVPHRLIKGYGEAGSWNEPF